ncbi:uncharacterized protein LOC110464707 [Mizuhopecten yessoensis]|uniref:Williams-Beuren syndrome chromosomal region 27 protein n=1 Tax=Mizuhopecten yessoensis TaxID=6573 RepID=A0A210R1W5_MIZYE|nr:uncharacterized protein LOC110464707 [Mizuhopecten yessoensis]XP_021375747.1 uncharacterized protein LOC110464707 [Mizuhopecten yessoensis]OWF55070.1 Williams-Beuren syndrome chromosomal region 27 protein [Mizuhopecten yessoensis]
MDEGKVAVSSCKSALLYNERACSYDQELEAKGYQGPSTAARALAAIFTDDRKNKVILDIGGGTGLVGEELKKEGFAVIDILDSADEMLAIARQRCIYRNVIKAEVKGHNSTPLEGDSFDAVLGVGVIFFIGNVGFTCSDIREMIRVTKPGGIIIMTLRTETLYSNLYRDKLLPLFDKLQSDGVWEQLERSQFKYMHGVEGQLFVYRKM